VVANLTTPILSEVAARLASVPRVLICSGLLASEADRVREAFANAGLRERERRTERDWAAIRFGTISE